MIEQYNFPGVIMFFKDKLNRLVLVASSIVLAAMTIWAGLMFYEVFTSL